MIQEKNTNFNECTEASLLQSLKPFTRKKAIALLNTIKEQGDQLTFDDSGNVFIEGDVLPNANIFELLKDLLTGKSVKPEFLLFVKKLQSMGLSKYIPKRHIPKNTDVHENFNLLHPFNLDKWYYLGP